MTIAALRHELVNIAQTYLTNPNQVQAMERLYNVLSTIRNLQNEAGVVNVVTELRHRLHNYEVSSDTFNAYMLGIWHFASGHINHDVLEELSMQIDFLQTPIYLQDMRAFFQRVDDPSINTVQTYIEYLHLPRHGEVVGAYNAFINLVRMPNNPNLMINELLNILDRTVDAVDALPAIIPNDDLVADNNSDSDADSHQGAANIVSDDEENEDAQVLYFTSNNNLDDIFSSIYQNAKFQPIISGNDLASVYLSDAESYPIMLNYASLEQISIIPLAVIEQLNALVGAVYAYFSETAELDN